MADSEAWLIDDIAITVVRSKRRRTLSIEVGSDGVKARAPMRMPNKNIAEFVQSKRNWIQRHLSELPPPVPSFEFKCGAAISLLGEPHTLEILPPSPSGRAKVSINESVITIPVVGSHLSAEESARRKLIKHLKSFIERELRTRVDVLSREMIIPSNKKLSVNVRDYKRRWGSCDHLGQLSFNWRIVFAPPEVIDYVVIHELAHCHEFNHSTRFWTLVSEQMPNWRAQQHWLQHHGAELYKF